MALRVGLYCLALFVVLARGQRIAERKCEEYRELTVKKFKTISLSLIPELRTHTILDCPKEDLILTNYIKKNEFPHQAFLGWKQSDDSEDFKFDCGGSLISERYVLTAAHCLKHGNPDIVRLGEHNIDDDTDNQVDFEIETIVRHPEYKFSASYHDIALIKLKENVTFSRAIRPACLWTEENINVTSVIATGFGSMETGGSSSKIIHKVILDLIDRRICEERFVGRRFNAGLIDSQLCIGSKSVGKDICQGDSGGPIQVLLEPKGCTYHIVGVASLGLLSCGDSPALYTRVGSYVNWIEGVVWKDE